MLDSDDDTLVKVSEFQCPKGGNSWVNIIIKKVEGTGCGTSWPGWTHLVIASSKIT